MKKVGSLLVAFVLLLNVSFGYTLMVTYDGDEIVRDVESGYMVIVGLSNREKAKYVVDTNNTILKYYGNRRQFVMPEEDVSITVTEGKTVADMRVGDYVKYYPLETAVDLTSLTGFEHEMLNPSLTTEWRVLSNDGTMVELISADSVVDLTLAQESFKNSLGEFTSGNEEIMEQSKENYANAIWILNQISRAYTNPRITNGWKVLGYNGTSPTRITTEISYNYVKNNAITGEPYKDTDNVVESTDFITISSEDMVHTGEDYVWVASRSLGIGIASDGVTPYVGFYVRTMTTDCDNDPEHLFFEYEDGSGFSSNRTNGVRPIISLNLETLITGSGTLEDKWVVPNPSDYTMADVRVGDYVKYYPEENIVNLTELTGFEHEELNTAETEDWRVLSINEDTGEVELISADSVGNLTLAVSSRKSNGVFTEGTEEIMEQSKLNYANGIYILNEISKAYEREGITAGSRGFGYNGEEVEKITTEISHAYVMENPPSEGIYSSSINWKM